MQIDPNYKYYLNNVAWPLALPLVENGVACGTVTYVYRCGYCTLADHIEHCFIYYVLENKWVKLRVNIVKGFR